MSETTAKAIFWVGTLVSVVLFLALTLDTHGVIARLSNADRIDAQVVAGKRAFERHNCNDCHTILGFGGYYAPDLTRVYRRIGEAAVVRRLEAPEVVFADSWRKMPQQHLEGQEIDSLVAYLRWVAEIDNHDWPPQHSEERWKRSTRRLLTSGRLSPAAALVKDEGCLECHALGDQGESTGPRLEWIGRRRGASWIAAYLEDPESFTPGAEMQSYDYLAPEQLQMIGEFIVALGNPERSEP